MSQSKSWFKWPFKPRHEALILLSLFLVCCVLPVWVGLQSEVVLGLIYVPIAALLSIMVRASFLARPLFDDFFPLPETPKVSSMANYVGKVPRYMCLICLLFLTVQTEIWPVNTVNPTSLFLLSGLVGLIIGLIAVILLPYLISGIYAESERRFELIFGLPVAIPLLFMTSHEYVNASTAFIADKTYEVHEVEDVGPAKFVYHHNVLFSDGNTFLVHQSLAEELQKGDSLRVFYYNGALGATVATKFEKISN